MLVASQMDEPQILKPAPGCRVVTGASEVVLFGQPPEVLKGLLREGIRSFDTLVLTDIREKNGSLLNNLEFPFYFFLFYANGFAENRKINLVGDANTISQALRLLRFTLFGPTRSELEDWLTEEGQRDEWLEISRYLALKNKSGEVIPVEGFFNCLPFVNDKTMAGELKIERKGTDHYLVSNSAGEIEVDLNQDSVIHPPYAVPIDHVTSGLAKLSLEVLGGASGFSTDEPCTGLAICHNGDYILIDSIPFLNAHLHARGIARNQITAVFLTHLHDDHCSMFPLMEMPHRVEIITTREIYNMAMEKLGCGLGWSPAVVEEHFKFHEVKPRETINYFGLKIEFHATVHSIPTIGATFSTVHRGQCRDVCIVGDNQSIKAIHKMREAGIARESTVANLDRLYKQNFHILIADGGSGEIHGDPFDALESKAERVVFVHVEKLPDVLSARFSLASSGKRYTLFETNETIYSAQINHYLTQWLGHPLHNRWLRSLLTEHEIYRYNTGDVILMQDTDKPPHVSLILTGYCEVIRKRKYDFKTIATLQAGDVIGEMTIMTGAEAIGASVVARTPVTVCVFGEDDFRHFVQHSGLQERLELRWRLRPHIKSLPQYSQLSSTVIDKISRLAKWHNIEAGNSESINASYLYILCNGEGVIDGQTCYQGDEFGWRAHGQHYIGEFRADSDCYLIRVDAREYQHLLNDTPQLNYQTRKRMVQQSPELASWLLGEVPVN
ncbi:MAG: cyclic nucleotide-binding domain-containing protein [Gammaproteobacteria bacterium]|nr:cyclic nucleotide-binding domain-containing protein [Gammaproteobacteria bacterium]